MIVIPPQPTLLAVDLTPSSAIVGGALHQPLSVKGRLSDGTEVSIGVAWAATVGTIDAGGLYTAPRAAVIATAQGDKADTSAVTITGTAPAPPSGMWLAEDFSRYNGSTATWAANPFGWRVEGPSWFNKQKISIDAAELYNGHPTLRYDWPGPAEAGWGGCSTSKAIVADYKAPTTREVWIEVAHKFASDFNARGPGCSEWAYKFLLMWRPTGDRYDIINGAYGNWWSAAPQKPAYPTEAWCTGYGSDCRWGHGPNQAQYFASVPGTQWDGQWHVYRVHIRISSSPTTADGIYEVWVDGKQVLGRYGMTNAKANGKWVGHLSEIFLGSNSNSGTATATRTWWGHLKVWTSNPGW